jgi:hypothetical protein
MGSDGRRPVGLGHPHHLDVTPERVRPLHILAAEPTGEAAGLSIL